MRTETLVILALARLHRERGENLGYRRDVVEVLEKMEGAGVGLGGIRFRPTPVGPHSEEVAEFIGRLTMGGYLRQESPIRLTSYGVDLINNHLRERVAETNTEVIGALNVLGLSDHYLDHGAAAPA